MERQFLQRNVSEDRFQKFLGNPAKIQGEVPDQRTAATEVDLSGAIGMASEAMNTYLTVRKKDQLAANDARTGVKKEAEERKNTILNDYAIEDNKIAMSVLQGQMSPRDAAIARTQLKQQFMQVAPGQITAADLNRQSNSNLNIDLGATDIRHQMERENEAIKRVEKAQFDSNSAYMTDAHPEIKNFVDPSMWGAIKQKDFGGALNVKAAFENVVVDKQLNPQKYVSGAPKTIEASQLEQASDSDMKYRITSALIQAHDSITEDGIVTDQEVKDFTAQMASWYSQNFGVDYNQALASARIYVDSTYGPAARQYEAQVEANIKRNNTVKNFQDMEKQMLSNQLLMMSVVGQTANIKANPALEIAMQGSSKSLLNTAIALNPGILQELMGTDVKAVLASRGEDVKSDDPTSRGAQAASYINLLQSVPMLQNLNPEDVSKYKAMAEVINNAATENFIRMSNMSDRDLIGYRIGQTMRAAWNNLNVPSQQEVEAIVEGNKEEMPAPEKMQNMGLMVRDADRRISAKENGTFEYNTAEDEKADRDISEQGQLIQGYDLMRDIVDGGRKSWMRYDEPKNEFFAVYDPYSDVSAFDAMDMAVLRENIQKINNIVQDPKKKYKRDGKEVDAGRDIAEQIVYNFDIQKMTKEESQNIKEKDVKYDESGWSKTTRDLVKADEAISTALSSIKDKVEGSEDVRTVEDILIPLAETGKNVAKAAFQPIASTGETVGEGIADIVAAKQGLIQRGEQPTITRKNQIVIDQMAEQYLNSKKEELKKSIMDALGKTGEVSSKVWNNIKEAIIPSAGASEYTPSRNMNLITEVSNEKIPEEVKNNFKNVAEAFGVSQTDILDKLAAESSMGTHPKLKKQSGNGAQGIMQVSKKAEDQLKKEENLQKIMKEVYPEFKWDRTNPMSNFVMGVAYMRYVQDRVDSKLREYGIGISEDAREKLNEIAYKWPGKLDKIVKDIADTRDSYHWIQTDIINDEDRQYLNNHLYTNFKKK